ncbi:MAG TPA: glycosyltransferase family 39 protein [bacterium]|nr:glycosyltransferase family 39 protein [bacterium]
MTASGSRSIALALLLAVLAAAFALRFHNLEARTMGHTESYVPGIVLPDDYGEPRARVTLKRAVVNSMWEVHPPGWYALMWGWTKVFGTGLTAVRMPGVLLSTGCVLLVFLLGAMEGNRRAGLVAAGLVALNGHQIYWAQVARPSAMLAFLGLLACVLMLHAVRGGPRARWALAGYGAVIWLGLTIEYYFWIFLAAHIAWNLLAGAKHRGAFSAILRVQLLAIILASPIVTLALFQSREAHFEGNVLHGYRDLLQLGFLFVSVSPLDYPAPEDVTRWLPWVGAVLLVAGLLAMRGRRGVAARGGGNGDGDAASAQAAAHGVVPAAGVRGPGLPWMIAAAVVMTGVVFLAARQYAVYSPAKAGKLLTTAAFPAFALSAAIVLREPGGLLFQPLRSLVWPRVTAAPSLAVTMAFLPALAIAVATFQVPLFAARQMYVFVPYVLLVMGAGMVWIAGRKPRMAGLAAATALAVVLGVAHARSYRWYETRLQSPHEYSELAEKWKPEIRDDDLILVEDLWATTPVFYYVELNRYRFIPRDWEAAVAEHPDARVWRLAFHNFPVAQGQRDALAGHRLERTIGARGVSVELWVPAAGEAAEDAESGSDAPLGADPAPDSSSGS